MRKLKMMMAESSGPPVSAEPVPPPPPAPPVKSKRKLYAVLGLVCIAVVVSALLLVFFVPRGLGETIPYGFNYTVGEKMTYNMSVTTSGAGQSFSETGTVGIDVLSFDGANYTMNETASLSVLGQSQQFSYTVKMDKSGRIVEISNLPSQMQQMSMFGMMPGFGFPSNKTEARVGETWQLPLNTNYSGIIMSGTMNYKFGDIQNITVPAGTYRAFRIDFSANNVQASTMGVSVSITMNGQLHLEYGTCRVIDMNMQATENMTQGTQTMTMSMNMQMQLTQHIKP
jgi:opacity protein-like surface antigen